jgi:hypothetical protein
MYRRIASGGVPHMTATCHAFICPTLRLVFKAGEGTMEHCFQFHGNLGHFFNFVTRLAKNFDLVGFIQFNFCKFYFQFGERTGVGRRCP